MGDDLHLMRDNTSGGYGVVDLGTPIVGPLAADVAITQLEIEGRGFSSDVFVDVYFAHSYASADDRQALSLYRKMRLAALVRWCAWRVRNASSYQPAEQESNERRFRRFLRRFQEET